MGEVFATVARSGPLLGAIAVATLAGLVSFLSPCVLPLVPGYLSYVTGLAGADLDAGHRRGRILAGVGLFIAGFSAVFILGAVLAAEVGLALYRHDRALEIGVGALIVLFGLAFAGLVPGLQREWRVSRLPAAGLVGAPVFGAVFALSWVPCVGPTLGAVLALAATAGSAPRAVTLAAAYCLGLGLPFLAFGLGFRRLLGVFRGVRRNSRWVTRTGGALLVLTGVALMTGAWGVFVGWLRGSITAFEVLV
jgi:cytochrome c-type biogenesis protein